MNKMIHALIMILSFLLLVSCMFIVGIGMIEGRTSLKQPLYRTIYERVQPYLAELDEETRQKVQIAMNHNDIIASHAGIAWAPHLLSAFVVNAAFPMAVIGRYRREDIIILIVFISAVVITALVSYQVGLIHTLKSEVVVEEEDIITIVRGASRVCASYIVYGENLDEDGFLDAIYAIDGQTGEVVAKGTNINSVINQVLERERRTLGWVDIFIKEGRFPVDGPILINRFALTFRGTGPKSTVLYLMDGANCNIFEFSGEMSIFWVDFRHMCLYGNRANNERGRAIYAPVIDGKMLSDVHIERLYILEFAEDGVYTENPWGWRIEHTVIEFFGTTNAHAGIHVTAGEDFKLIANKINRNKNGAILGTNGAIIIGNLFRGNEFWGLDLRYFNRDNIVVGNRFKCNSRAKAGYADELRIRINARGNVIVGNTFEGDWYSNYGVNIADSSVFDTVITGNSFRKHVSGAIHDAGTNTIIVNNQGFTTENHGVVFDAVNGTWPGGNTHPHNTDDKRL